MVVTHHGGEVPSLVRMQGGLRSLLLGSLLPKTSASGRS